jgi:hypothetical protein
MPARTSALRAGCGLVAGLLVACLTSIGNAQEEEFNPTAAANEEVELRFADYEARLNAILKTRRLEEQEFVNAVLQKVRAGELPVPMMESSFLWVLSNRPDTPYPFIYFERVLRLQAELADVSVPDFDYGIYSEYGARRRENLISHPAERSGSHGFSTNRR